MYSDVKIIMLLKLSKDIKSKEVDLLPVNRQVCIRCKTSYDPILNS